MVSPFLKNKGRIRVDPTMVSMTSRWRFDTVIFYIFNKGTCGKMIEGFRSIQIDGDIISVVDPANCPAFS